MFARVSNALFLLAFFLIGLFSAYAANKDHRIFKAIADHGKAAEATVHSVSWKGKSWGLQKTFEIDIQFETEGKQTVKRRLRLDRPEAQRLRDSGANTVQIKYLPESPSTVLLANATDESGLMMITGSLTALCVGIAVFRRRKKAAEVPAAA